MSDIVKLENLLQRIKETSFAGTEEWLSRKFLGRDASEIIVYSSVICYTLIFSYFTVLKYWSFHAYAWDLGIFNQSFWTTLHGGGLFTSTTEQFICPSGSFFATHFSPVLFFVLPVYAAVPSPETLLVVQSFVLASAAVPLYFFAKHTLNSRVASVVFALCFLFFPALQGINWFDFHAQAFLPLFVFSTFYFLAKEKWLLYFGGILLCLTVAENVPLVVVFIGLYCFWRFRKQILESVKARSFSNPSLIVPIFTILVALIWLGFSSWIRQAYFPFDTDFTELYKAVDHWSVLGIRDDPLSLPLYLVTTPARVFEALSYDYLIKLIYLVLLFGPLLFLSLRSMITAVALVWFVPALLSNYAPYYMIGAQYPAYPIAFIFLGAVEGLRHAARPNGFPTLSWITKRLLLVGIVVMLFLSPLSPAMTDLAKSYPFFSDYHLPTITDHDRILGDLIGYIPKNASVLTQNKVFPHVSSRTNAYVYPLDWMIGKYNSTKNQTDAWETYVERLFAESDYVIIDATDNYTASWMLSRIYQKADYGLYVQGENAYLFKKGYLEAPISID